MLPFLQVQEPPKAELPPDVFSVELLTELLPPEPPPDPLEPPPDAFRVELSPDPVVLGDPPILLPLELPPDSPPSPMVDPALPIAPLVLEILTPDPGACVITPKK